MLDTPVELLIGEDSATDAAAVVPARRTKRGPPSKIERQFDAIAQLPKAEQRFIAKMLDTVLAQHHGQEAAPAA